MVICLESRCLFSYQVVSYDIGVHQESVVTADWNHDGKVGFAVSSYNDRCVKIGYKSFGGIVNTSVKYNYVTIPFGVGIDHVAAANLNGDLLPDLVVSSFDSNSFGVLFNRGGSFVFDRWYNVENLNSVALGDFDRDGIVDIACGRSFKTGLISYFGVGDGSFVGPFFTPSSFSLNSVAIGDVVGGNGRDAVGVDYAANKVIVFRYDGGSVFVQDEILETSHGPADVVIGDVIGDADLDIVSADFLSNNISVFSGSSRFVFAAGVNPTGLSVVDYDGDGDKDLAVVCAGNDVLLKFNHNGNNLILDSSLSIARPVNVSWNPSAVDVPIPRRIIAGFYDNDNMEDLFICNENVNRVSISYYNHLFTFGPLPVVEVRYNLVNLL